jgi:hypothetical protein
VIPRSGRSSRRVESEAAYSYPGEVFTIGISLLGPRLAGPAHGRQPAPLPSSRACGESHRPRPGHSGPNRWGSSRACRPPPPVARSTASAGNIPPRPPPSLMAASSNRSHGGTIELEVESRGHPARRGSGTPPRSKLQRDLRPRPAGTMALRLDPAVVPARSDDAVALAMPLESRGPTMADLKLQG